MLIALVTTECFVNLSTEDDRSFCRNMSCKFKSVVVFYQVRTKISPTGKNIKIYKQYIYISIFIQYNKTTNQVLSEASQSAGILNPCI